MYFFVKWVVFGANVAIAVHAAYDENAWRALFFGAISGGLIIGLLLEFLGRLKDTSGAIK